MKRTPMILALLIMLGISFSVRSDDNVLQHYQQRGLTFVNMKGVPDQVIGAQLVKAIYGRLNIPITIKTMPGKRALKQAQEGKVDGESMRIMRIQEVAPSLIRLSPHINFVAGSVFVKDTAIEVNGWASLKPYKVGIVRGVQYLKDGTRGFKNLHIAESDSALIDMLNRGRIDLLVTAQYNGELQLRKKHLHNAIRPLAPPVTTLRLYNYLHVKHRQLAPIIEDHLREMYTSGELQSLRAGFIEEAFSKESSGG